MLFDQLYIKLRGFQHRTSFPRDSNAYRFLFSKRGAYTFLTLLFTLVLLTLSYHPARITYVKEEELVGAPEGYRPIIENYNIDRYGKTSIANRCSYYFEALYENDPEWILEELDKGHHTDNTIFASKEKFIADKKQAFREKFSSMSTTQFEQLVESKGKLEEWEDDYEESKSLVRGSEQYSVDQLTNLKVFQKCYLDHYLPKSKQEQIDNNMGSPENPITCADHEKKLFYYLTRELPTYTRWDGTVLKDSLPVMKDYSAKAAHKQQPQTTEQTVDLELKNSCFTRFLRNSYNGKGIALTITMKGELDKHLLGLLLTLRALGNKLPIQIFHNGEMEQSIRGEIVHIARSTKIQLDNVEALKNMKNQMKNIPDPTAEGSFPPLDIWFVDIKDAVSAGGKYEKDSAKLITYLFSSFEDTLLLDLDTVPMVNLNKHIFKSKEYKSNGALFFKDKQLSERLTDVQAKFLSKLLPSEYDHKIFNINLPSAQTLKNRVFGSGFKNLQSSGMIAINKREHFNAVLASLTLNLWDNVMEAISSEKELFWIGFVLTGDEQYYMNKLAAGAVGEINPKKNRLLHLSDDGERRTLKSTQLCSSHVGHLSPKDEHTLLWIDSGITFCEWSNPVTIDEDFFLEIYNKEMGNKDVLKAKYESPITIRSLIIPPPQDRMKNSAGHESSIGWEASKGCHASLWCVYDRVGGSEDPFYHGKTVTFDSEETRAFDFIGQVWSNTKDIVAFST